MEKLYSKFFGGDYKNFYGHSAYNIASENKLKTPQPKVNL